jgi:hypothetical protein
MGGSSSEDVLEMRDFEKFTQLEPEQNELRVRYLSLDRTSETLLIYKLVSTSLAFPLMRVNYKDLITYTHASDQRLASLGNRFI